MGLAAGWAATPSHMPWRCSVRLLARCLLCDLLSCLLFALRACSPCTVLLLLLLLPAVQLAVEAAEAHMAAREEVAGVGGQRVVLEF